MATTKAPLDPVTQYAREVDKRRILAGPYVRAAAARHLADVKCKGWRWRFDPALVGRSVRFFSNVLHLNAGEFEGAPFRLELPQAFIVGSIFGWVDPENGQRRFRTAYIEQGKGNGKSPLAAGIGLYLLVADREARSEVYAAAAKKDQALVLFRDAVAMVKQSPSLMQRMRLIGGANPWNIVFGDSFFRPISSDGRHSGPRPHGALIDELHEHRDSGVIEMLRAGFKFRHSPLLFVITNSGVDRQSVCWQYHQHAINVCNGTLDDERFFSYVCALDEGDDPLHDESVWMKANPLLGVSIQPDYLRGQVAEALAMPAKEAIVRRLHFCQWTDAESPWISGDAWAACEIAPTPITQAFAECDEVVLSVDLSTTTDLSALAITGLLKDGRTIRAAVEYWTPGDTLRARAERDSVPYDVWHKQGHLQIEPGATLSYGPIARRVSDLCDALPVSCLVFDRWRMAYLRKELDAIGVSVPLVEHPQGWVKVTNSALWMPQSINELESSVLKKRLQVLRNPVLTWNSASAVVKTDDQQNRIFSKRKSTGRIDGLVALAMGVGRIKSPEFDVGALIA